MTETTYITSKHTLLLEQELLFNLPIKGKIHVKRFNGIEYAYINKKYKGKTTTYLLHRMLMETFLKRKLDKSEKIDHINGNTLDNRLKNLRICSHTENMRNRKTSGFKGVSKTASGKYRARITVNNKELHLGSFKSKEEAAKAYNEAANKYYGVFARLNKEL